jgi:hypothetical protein
LDVGTFWHVGTRSFWAIYFFFNEFRIA